MVQQYIGYRQTASGQTIAVRGTRKECLDFARANPGMACEIRKAINT